MIDIITNRAINRNFGLKKEGLLLQGENSIEGAKEDLSLCCADSVAIKAERFVDKNAIETAFLFIPTIYDHLRK